MLQYKLTDKGIEVLRENKKEIKLLGSFNLNSLSSLGYISIEPTGTKVFKPSMMAKIYKSELKEIAEKL
jgi:DNA-binding PadR family transcriptional regulator